MKRILILLACTLLLSSAVYASDDPTNKKLLGYNGGVTYEATSVQAGQTVTLVAYSGDINIGYDAFLSGKYADKTIFVSTEKTDGDKKCKFNFYVGASGGYTFYTGIGDENAVRERIIYADYNASNSAVATLKEAAYANKSAQESVQLIDGFKRELMISTDLYSPNDLTAADIILDYLRENSAADIYEVSDAIDKAYLISALKGVGDIKISDYLYSADIADTARSEFFTKYAEDVIAGAVKRAETIKEFDSILDEQLAVTTILYNKNLQTVKNALAYYSAKIGIEASMLTNSLVSSICGKEFQGFLGVKEFINEYKPFINENGGGNSPSSPKGGIGAATYASSSANSSDGSKQSEIFGDLSEVSWAKEAIEGLWKAGVISGRSENIFSPDDYVLREEVAKMLVTMLELNVLGEDIPFGDVPKESWCYDYVKRAFNSGVVNGISENTFGMGNNILRQDFAVMAVNGLKACNIEIPVKRESHIFADGAAISDYAEDAIDILYCAGIIDGDENGRFNPFENATRAEAAKILWRIYCMLE